MQLPWNAVAHRRVSNQLFALLQLNSRKLERCGQNAVDLVPAVRKDADTRVAGHRHRVSATIERIERAHGVVDDHCVRRRVAERFLRLHSRSGKQRKSNYRAKTKCRAAK